MHKFQPENASRLENEERHALLKPDTLLRQFGLEEGMDFLDIGSGTGFFSRAASRIIGENGKVYSADISEKMLDAFRSYGVPKNVHLILSNEYEIPLSSALTDMALFAFVLHESKDIRRSVIEAARIIKPEGRIVIIEWKRQLEEHGPPIDDRISLNDLLTEVHGFKIISSGDLNPSHYYCILSANHETEEAN